MSAYSLLSARGAPLLLPIRSGALYSPTYRALKSVLGVEVLNHPHWRCRWALLPAWAGQQQYGKFSKQNLRSNGLDIPPLRSGMLGTFCLIFSA